MFVAGGRKGRQISIANNLLRLQMVVRSLNRSGKLLVVLGVMGLVWAIWPMVGAEMKYALGQTRVGKFWVRLANVQVELVKEKAPGEVVEKEKPDWKVPSEDFSVYIPKILAKSRVIPGVNPANKQEYMQALKLGVAQAAGLADPGEKGTIYLFAHSVGTRADFARYNAVFYLLHKLEAGDVVEVVFKGKLYKYEVEDREILEAGDLRYFEAQMGEELLVLQTCYPPGTAWKRLIVLARRVVPGI